MFSRCFGQDNCSKFKKNVVGGDFFSDGWPYYLPKAGQWRCGDSTANIFHEDVDSWKTIREMRVSCWRSFWQETNARTRASKPNRGRCGACLGHAGLCWFPWQLHGSSKLPAAEGRSVFCRILVFMTIYASIFSKLRFYAVYLHVYAHVIYLRFIFIFVFTSWALGIFFSTKFPLNWHPLNLMESQQKKERFTLRS